MTIAHLCDHRGIIWRATVIRDEAKDRVEVWEPLEAPANLNCRPHQGWAGTLGDPGAGEVQAAGRVWFLVAGFDVRERDVLQVTVGPEAPSQLRVLSVTRPTNPFQLHHLEVNVEPFVGNLEEPAGAS